MGREKPSRQSHHGIMKFLSSALVTVACWTLLAQPATVLAANDELTVRLPSFIMRSASLVRAQVWIPRDHDNRVLRVTLDSGTFYRSSDVPLEGERAPHSHTLVWHALPPGAYEVTIELVGTTRVKQILRRELTVIGLD
jgi:hypothetical protein